jgi:hypothetical protein
LKNSRAANDRGEGLLGARVFNEFAADKLEYEIEEENKYDDNRNHRIRNND